MKNIFICLKMSKIYCFIIILILILVVCFLGKTLCHNIKKIEMNNTKTMIENSEKNNIDKMKGDFNENNIELIAKNTEINSIDEEEKIIENSIKNTTKLEEYKTMPQEIEGYKVVGKIQISKINLESYILSETNNDTLKVSITKLCGPEINGVGNFCIAGHNYNKFFSKIKNLNMKDTIILTDSYDNSVTYEVYDSFETSPQDISCLKQDTRGERELTLITCTKGALKRFIIKAVEVYD